MALRDDLIKRGKTPRIMTPVPTPEWPDYDGEVFVPNASSADMDRYYDAIKGNGRALAVAMFACDASGNRHFNDADADWLGQNADFSVTNRIYSKLMEVNYSTRAQQAGLEKNS